MKRILIIFPDHWFSYSPTLMNIFNLLSENFDVQVSALELELNGYPACARFDDDRIKYVKFPQIPKLLWRILCKMESLYNKYIGKYSKKISAHKMIQAIVMFLECRKIKADEVIAVDSVGFFIAQLLFRKVHFVSLEISKDDIFYQQLVKNASKIKSIIIQSKERLRLLDLPFAGTQDVFIVQNAPIYQDNGYRPSFNGRLIYFGSANLVMGIGYIFAYITQFNKYFLTVKGLYSLDLLNQHFTGITKHNNIRFDDSYTNNRDIQEYLSHYSIGFCFYDFNHVPEVSKQNMLYAPSGKLFNYFAAGLPVIGSNIPGLSSVSEYKAGILLDEPTPEDIERAVEQIKSNYKFYSDNCKRAAKDYCFKKSFSPFIDFIEE